MNPQRLLKRQNDVVKPMGETQAATRAEEREGATLEHADFIVAAFERTDNIPSSYKRRHPDDGPSSFKRRHTIIKLAAISADTRNHTKNGIVNKETDQELCHPPFPLHRWE